MIALPLLALLLVGVTATIVVARLLPRSGPPARVEWLEASVALVLLLTLLTPWSHLYLRSLSDADQDETALAWFGPTYTVAKHIMEECTEFHSHVGGLTGFRLSPRESRLDDTVYWAFGYFDFDFVGGDGRGRATVGVLHLKEISPGDPLNPPRPESFVSRLYDQGGALPEALPFSIVVYPNYGDFFEQIECKSLPRSFSRS